MTVFEEKREYLLRKVQLIMRLNFLGAAYMN